MAGDTILAQDLVLLHRVEDPHLALCRLHAPVFEDEDEIVLILRRLGDVGVLRTTTTDGRYREVGPLRLVDGIVHLHAKGVRCERPPQGLLSWMRKIGNLGL